MSAAAARPERALLARPPRPRGPVLRTVSMMVRQQLVVVAWAWGIVAVVAIAVPLLVQRATDVDMSVLAFAWQLGIWAPFSMHIGVAATYLPVHVASGMTRRSYVRSALLTAVVMGVVFAVLQSVGLALERLWYQAQGWVWAYREGSLDVAGAASAAEGSGRVLLYAALTYTIAGLSGQLVGVAYYRGGGWWGTLTLPLTVGPLILMAGLVSGGTGPVPVDDWFDVGPGVVPVLFVVGVAVVIGTLLAAALRAQVARVAISAASS